MPDLRAPDTTLWAFEPHVAEDIFFQMINEAKVPVYFQQRLHSVKKDGARITEIVMENRKTYHASMFIDATYEGDLMAKAGVSYTIGREANNKYKETLNGICAKHPSTNLPSPLTLTSNLVMAAAVCCPLFKVTIWASPEQPIIQYKHTTSGFVTRRIPTIACPTLRRRNTIRPNTNCSPATLRP